MGKIADDLRAKKVSTTAEELDAQEAEFERRWSAIVPARAAIIATKKRSGAIDCPLCKTPDGLAFTVSSYNGHVHAHCRTKECLSWME